MSTSEKSAPKKAGRSKRFIAGSKVNRAVIHHYEKLVRETSGCVVERTGADYRIAPTIGTSPLLVRSRSGQ